MPPPRPGPASSGSRGGCRTSRAPTARPSPTRARLEEALMARVVRNKSPGPRTSWDAVATWYDGWMGPHGSEHHRRFAIPAALALADLRPGEALLDVGAGQGVLAPYVTAAGVRYVGVDASERLVRIARRRHGQCGTFLEGDARHLEALAALGPSGFDAVVFLLSLQDMDDLRAVLASAGWAVRAGGRVVVLMRHP